jgi:hypothetical protein
MEEGALSEVFACILPFLVNLSTFQLVNFDLIVHAAPQELYLSNVDH